MNLSQIAAAVSESLGSPKLATKEILKAAFGTIQSSVKKGERVSIAGFGAFFKGSRKARVGRNPHTGEKVKIPAMNLPRFKAGKEFKSLIRKGRG